VPGAYWPQPWTAEDGGPLRRCCADGIPGLAIAPGERLEVAAVRDAFGTGMVVRRDPGELFALRHDVPVRGPQAGPVDAWVERLDPLTLAPLARSPRLPGGPFWPGGMACHASGDLHVVFGEWAHRLDAGLDVLASRRLPVARPHNSFVLLDSGELVLKDCDAPAGRAPSTVHVLDPGTLEPVAPALRLPEPSIARLSGDGERVVAVGTTALFALRLDRDAGRLVLEDAWRPRYGPAPGRSYGWDPVITAEHVLWMDNGRNHTDRTMRGSGTSPDPVRLWWARRDDDAAVRSVEISGLPYGTQSNPPAWEPAGGVVVAYDAGNAVLRGFRLIGDELQPLWRRDALCTPGTSSCSPTRASSSCRTSATSRGCAGPSCAARCGRGCRCSGARPACAARPCAPAATSSSSSTSTRAPTRPGWTCRPPARPISSPPPASTGTSSTSR
jgi:hypothetical protein